MDLETMRSYVDGTLPDEDRAAWEAQLATDPELARAVETYRLIVRATDVPAPKRSAPLTFSRKGEPVWRRRLVTGAVAAALLLAASFALWPQPKAADSRDIAAVPIAPKSVSLQAIPLGPIQPLDIPSWPRALASFTPPRGDVPLAWQNDLAEAEAWARASNRPLLVFLHHEQCPLCRQYERGPFRQREVIAAAQDFVMLKLTHDAVPAWIAETVPEGWPVLAVYEPRGRILAGLTGVKQAPRLAQWLQRGARAWQKAGHQPPPSWDALQKAAQKMEQAAQADDPAVQLALWKSVETDGPDGVLRDAARAQRVSVEASIQAELFAVRDGPLAHAAAALAQLAQAWRGTAYADDLARIRRHVERHGVFPELRSKNRGG